MEMTEIILFALLVVSPVGMFCAAIFLIKTRLEKIEKQLALINNDNPSINPGDLVNLAIANWRFIKNTEKMGEKLEPKERKRFENTQRQFQAFLDQYNVKAEDYTGKRYNDGMNVKIIALEEDNESEIDYIKDTEKPAIYIDGSIYERSIVVVARGTKNKEEKASEKQGVKKDGEK